MSSLGRHPPAFHSREKLSTFFGQQLFFTSVNILFSGSLAPVQKRLQEAKFELLTSEASYLNSLNVLEAHFIAHPAFREAHILPRADWETLFSTILPGKPFTIVTGMEVVLKL